jgi:hypothetical protein
MSFERAQSQYDAQEPREASRADFIHAAMECISTALNNLENAATHLEDVNEPISRAIWDAYELIDNISLPWCCKACD